MIDSYIYELREKELDTFFPKELEKIGVYLGQNWTFIDCYTGNKVNIGIVKSLLIDECKKIDKLDYFQADFEQELEKEIQNILYKRVDNGIKV